MISCVKADSMLITWMHFFKYRIHLFYLKKPNNIIMVSGTDGKTSVVDYIRQIWNMLGHVYATISTLRKISWIHRVYLNITVIIQQVGF